MDRSIDNGETGKYSLTQNGFFVGMPAVKQEGRSVATRIREVQMMTIQAGYKASMRRLKHLAHEQPCKQTPSGLGTLVSTTTWVWRDRGKTAALSPRTEIDFLSIHSTAQMSSFDNCCVIECVEYWRVSSSCQRICQGCLVLWVRYRKPTLRKTFRWKLSHHRALEISSINLHADALLYSAEYFFNKAAKILIITLSGEITIIHSTEGWNGWMGFKVRRFYFLGKWTDFII